MLVEELFNKYKNYTALSEGYYEYLVDDEDFKEALIEFAEYHVEQALKQASIKVSMRDVQGSIKKSYPLENIK